VPGRRCVSLALPSGAEATPSERDAENTVGNWPPLLSAVS
jgi:hypothetical protein